MTSSLADGGLIGPPGGPAAARLRVLLVEDDEADAFLVRELLAEAGAPVDLRGGDHARRGRASARRASTACCSTWGCPTRRAWTACAELLRGRAGGARGLRADRSAATSTWAPPRSPRAPRTTWSRARSTGCCWPGPCGTRWSASGPTRTPGGCARWSCARPSRPGWSAGLLPQPLMRHDRRCAVHTVLPAGPARGLLGGDFYDVVQTAPDRLDADRRRRVRARRRRGGARRRAAGGLAGADARRGGRGRGAARAGAGADQRAPARGDVRHGGHGRRRPDAATRRRYGWPGTRRRCCSPAARSTPVPGAARTGARRATPAGRVPPPTSGCDTEDWSLLMYTDGLIEGTPARPGDDRLDVAGLCDLLDRARGPGDAARRAARWLVGRAEAGQRRAARRRRGHAAAQPGWGALMRPLGRWATDRDGSLVRRWNLRQRITALVATAVAVLLMIAALAGAAAAVSRSRMDTLAEIGPMRIDAERAARRRDRPGDRDPGVRAEPAGGVDLAPYSDGVAREREIDRGDAPAAARRPGHAGPAADGGGPDQPVARAGGRAGDQRGALRRGRRRTGARHRPRRASCSIEVRAAIVALQDYLAGLRGDLAGQATRASNLSSPCWSRRPRWCWRPARS